MSHEMDGHARAELLRLATQSGLDVKDGKIRRSSSRFCLGVEHGDYNGTSLFGIGTDRFIWMAYKPNGSNRIRLASGSFPDEGVITYKSGATPLPRSAKIANTWGRFPFGVDFVLRRAGFDVAQGFDAVLWGNIPGGGMSRSASLSLNLIMSVLDVNGIPSQPGMKVVDLAHDVENDYVGSPCGKLDQIMIYFAKEGMGTFYDPRKNRISYVPLGTRASDFRIVSLDTGTVRPGLEKSTYKIRRAECEQLVKLAGKKFGITCLAEVRTAKLFNSIVQQFHKSHPHLCDRLAYIYHSQQRFQQMMKAWKAGDIETVGSIFRADGIGLRDEYNISGRELETMCDVIRWIPGVLGERMLGGGDKGASGAIVRTDSVDAVRAAVEIGYPRSHPAFADRFAVHVCRMVQGITELPGL